MVKRLWEDVSPLASEPLLGFVPIKFATVPHYLSAASQLVTCEAVEGAEGSCPLPRVSEGAD